MSIRFENVTKSFGSRTILNQLSFEVKVGEILFIIGKSGMGKSVTLKHIVGLLKPDSGKVFVEENHIAQLKDTQLAQARKRCGMIFQHPALLDSLNILQNVSFGLRMDRLRLGGSRTGECSKPLSEKQIREKVIQKLALVNLGEGILERKPPELSYGMQKRVAIARTLAPDPSYLLFDEPTTGLDPITTRAVNDLILDLSRKLRVTSVVVSHDMACALEIADRILVLDQGKVLAHAPVSEIKQSREPLIQEFLSETLGMIPYPHQPERSSPA